MMVFSQMGLFAGGLIQYLVPFVFVLTIVVFFHELGHFLVGRWCGVKVDVFSIGFGPELFGRNDRHGTRWRCAAIPLGGYVKFHGDLNGASVPDSATLRALPAAERSRTFFGQPLWKRALIVAAGPAASFLFAMVVFSITFYVFGLQTIAPRIKAVTPNSAAEAAGFKPGDLVLSTDGHPVATFADIQGIVSVSGGEVLTFEVQRDGAVVRLEATPRYESVDLPFKHNEARLGIQASNEAADVHSETVSPIRAVALGAGQTWELLDRTATVLGRLFTGREAANQVSGPIGIATVSGEMAKIGFSTLLNWAAILSASIGFFNLIPIPLLDGGHLLYYAIEALRGRPLSLRAQEVGFRIGLAIVGLLMVFATSNDLMRIVPSVVKHLGIGG